MKSPEKFTKGRERSATQEVQQPHVRPARYGLGIEVTITQLPGPECRHMVLEMSVREALTLAADLTSNAIRKMQS